MMTIGGRLLSTPGALARNSRLILLSFLALFIASVLVILQKYSLSVAAILLVTMLAPSLRSKELSIFSTVAFLILLGDIRRLTATVAGFQPLDPVLLVGVFMAAYLAVPQLVKVRLTEPLSKLLLALTFVMTLEMFNPRQGPLAVGISGALFFTVPTLWFWIGRRYGSDKTLEILLYRVIVPLGVAAALLGIYQVYVGLFPWEEAWAKTQGPQYFLTNGAHPRAFAFSSSGAEYGNLLLITSVILCGAGILGRRLYLFLLPVVVVAMVLSSMRGPVVRTIFALAVMWAIRGRKVRVWIPRLAVGLVLGLGLLSYSASKAATDTTAPENNAKNSTASIAGTRVAQGLAHPFESRYSTGGIHFQLFQNGVKAGFVQPLGTGLGATTIGASKFGGNSSVSFSSEIDLSDLFITCGAFGGCLYIWFLAETVRAIPAFVLTGPPRIRIVAVGILASLFGSWTSLAQYGTAAIAWICLGALAYHTHRESYRIKLARESCAIATAQ